MKQKYCIIGYYSDDNTMRSNNEIYKNSNESGCSFSNENEKMCIIVMENNASNLNFSKYRQNFLCKTLTLG